MVDDNNERIVNVIPMAMFVDEKTGMILSAILSDETKGEPLEKLSKKMFEYFAVHPSIAQINRTIYVNDNASEMLLRKILSSQYKIIRKYEPLAVDAAYDDFAEYYKNK